MKKSLLIVSVLLILLTLTSCGSNANNIVGKWYSAQHSTTFEFNSDGTYSTGAAEGTYEVEGDTLILNQPSGNSTRFTYTIDGDELDLVSGDYEYVLYKQ